MINKHEFITWAMLQICKQCEKRGRLTERLERELEDSDTLENYMRIYKHLKLTE